MRFEKASTCADNACVEVGWVRPNRCENLDCVEVASDPAEGGVFVRNSTEPGTVVRFSPSEWREFLDGIRNTKDFDLA